MDIAELSVAMSQSKVQQSAGVALIKKAMDNNERNAIQMTDMMQSNAVDPNLGQHVDVRV